MLRKVITCLLALLLAIMLYLAIHQEPVVSEAYVFLQEKLNEVKTRTEVEGFSVESFRLASQEE